MLCLCCAATVTTEQARRTALGYRTFRCRACRRTCNERTGTPFNHLQYPTDLVLLVVLWRLRYKLSLGDLNASKQYLRHPGQPSSCQFQPLQGNWVTQNQGGSI